MTSLSNSVLWQRMHEYYDQLGPEIWEDEVVPLQITSNTYLANIYAKLIIAQMQDYIAKHGTPTEQYPFHIIEIGAGHGRFSFYLLKNLQCAFEIHQWPTKWLKYIMTDISHKSLASWKKHHALKAFTESGCLDFAQFNALEDTELCLKLCKKTIKPKTLKSPLFVICNYIFDTLTQDAFQVIDGKLHEVELIIKNENKISEKELKNYFKKASYQFKKHPIDTNYYTNQPALNKILEYYQNEFENISFLIPVGAIKCIDNLHQFTDGPLSFLVSDKGITENHLFDEKADPDISFHGSVSMMVNFDALKQFTELHNGTCYLMGNKGADFQVANFCYQTNYPAPNAAYAFSNSLSSFSPQDLFDICYVDDEPNKGFKTIESIVNMLNMADWDPNIFYDYYPILLEKLESNTIALETEYSILNGIERVWQFFFKLEKSQDLPFAIATILYNMDFYEKAIEFYQYSLEYFGEDKETYYNLALIHQALDNNHQAKLMLSQALTIYPAYRDAKKLLKEIEKKLLKK